MTDLSFTKKSHGITEMHIHNQPEPELQLSSSNEEYLLGNANKPSYKLKKPFVPDAPWDIEKLTDAFFPNSDERDISIVKPTPAWLSEKNNQHLNKIVSSLPNGKYLLKEIEHYDTGRNDILLGGERGKLDISSFELLSTKSFYSAAIGVTREDENKHLLLGIPILSYDGTSSLHAVIFFSFGIFDKTDNGKSIVIIPRSGPLIIDSYEDYVGNNTDKNKKIWDDKLCTEFFKAI